MESKPHFQGPDAWIVRLWWHFGQRVKELRTSKGWTQTDLAAQLGELGIDMHQTTVAKLEGGTRPTAVHEVWALAKLLDATYEDLLPPVQPMEAAHDLAAALRSYERLKAVAAVAERDLADARTAAKQALQEVQKLRETVAQHTATGHLRLEGRAEVGEGSGGERPEAP